MQSSSLLIDENQKEGKVTLDLTVLDKPSQLPCFDCLIVLNNHFEPWMLTMFIGKAKAVIASDGGANHLFNSAHRDASNLHSIVGDMDSLEGSTLSYYQTKGVTIHKDEGQDNNDFEKAVILAGKLGFRTLVCLGALGGRIDQELCNLNVIEKFSKLKQQRFIALGKSLMFMIWGGETAQIKVGECCHLEQVGIFCFGRSRVITEGFKWNLSAEDPKLEWGTFISSSNKITAPQASIQTEDQLFFTIELLKCQQQKTQ